MKLDKKHLPWMFVGLACVLLAPSLVWGVREAHDIKFHLLLFLSHRDAVQLGAWYPRWLPDQMHGLGSPTLLFYPPLASTFFVLIDILTLHALAPERVLGLAAVLLALASAATFYLWARAYANARLALIVALFYATAPYHLNLDLYARGAMAEYAAFIWIPLIFLGIRTSILVAHARGAALLAISLGALFLTHLLTAMLIAPLALCYALICLRTELPAGLRVRRFVLVAVTVVLGVALGAFYYLPAVSLLPEANSAGLYRDVATTNIFFMLRGLADRFQLELLSVTCAYPVLFLYLSAETWRNWRRQRALEAVPMLALMWIVTGILCFAFITGMFPFVFRPPSPYSQIQFVWRLLVVMEFSLASLFLCSVAGTLDAASRTRLLRAGLLALLLLGAAQCLDIVARFHNIPVLTNTLRDTDQVKWRLSPIEYFPIGTKTGQNVRVAIKPFEAYATASQAAFIAGDKGKLVGAERKGARFTVHTIATEPVVVMIQQFYFPGWKAVDEHGREIAVFRDEASRLASYVVPAGEHTVVVERSQSRQEYWGNIISIVALALLALELGLLVRRRKLSPLPSQQVRQPNAIH